MFLVNSCSHHFTAAPSSVNRQGRTFSRSYGTILPSSFTRFLSSALEFSSHPPVSVWGTVKRNLKLRGFSWKHGIDHLAPEGVATSYLSIKNPDLPKFSAYVLEPGTNTRMA